MKASNLLLIVLMSFLLMAGCGAESSDSNSAPQSATASESSMPDTLLKNVNAQQIQDVIAAYRGDKAVLVNVWATWCAPCVEEFPEIVKLQRKYPKELQVVFISADFPEDRERAVQFLKDHNVNWTTYYKDAKDEPFINALSREWSGALPFTKVIDTNGEEVAHWEMKASFDKFHKHVQQAIKP